MQRFRANGRSLRSRPTHSCGARPTALLGVGRASLGGLEEMRCSCLVADVQAQLAADGAPFELEEIVAQLRELERHREVRVRRGRLWRVRQ